MFILGQIFKLIQIINSEKGAYAIAAGFALGVAAGFVPSNPIILVLFFFLICMFRINAAAFFLSWGIFKLVAFFLDPLFDQLGFWLLTGLPALQPFFTKMYNMPVVPWSRFNNTIVAGSLLLGVALFVPLLFLFKFLLSRYRDSVLKKITNSKWLKVWKTTKIYKLWAKYERVKGALS